MLFTTTQQQEEIRKTVREFAETEIKPIAFMLDKDVYKRQISSLIRLYKKSFHPKDESYLT